MYFETLNIDAMKALWGRKISDLGFSDFLNILKYVAKKTGKAVKQIDVSQHTTELLGIHAKTFTGGGVHMAEVA